MERIEVQYVNEYRKKEGMGDLAFIALTILGFLVAVGALCSVLWVIV